MKSWKVLLGVGGACAACCALPIAGGFAGLGALAAGGLALSMDAMFGLAAALAVPALGGLALWIRRRQAARGAGVSSAVPAARACGCRPGFGCA